MTSLLCMASVAWLSVTAGSSAALDEVSMIQAQLQAYQRQEPWAQTQDDGRDAFQPTGQPKTSVQRFGHVPVYGYERARPKGPEDAEGVEWMVMFSERWSTNRLKEFCVHNISAPARCIYVGNPNEGGLHYITIKGYEPQVKACVSGFSADEGPRFVELDGPMSLLPTPYQPGDLVRTASASSVPWGLDRIDNGKEGLDGKYTQGEGGRGAHIYHFDTGIQPEHPDFGGRAVPTLDVGVISTFDSARGCAGKTCAFDRQGHGTHTAGTIAGREFGVAKQATVHACKILNDHGYGSWSSFVHAVDWVMTNGQRPAIVSASLGGSGKMLMVKEAIERAVASDITVVVAAGNDATDTCHFTPAYVRAAITVGATDYFDTFAPYSNWGACMDIFAPGTNIISIDINKGGSVAMSGTSMSAPHVAGVAALILGENPTLTPAEVQARIVMGATRNAVNGIKQTSTKNRLLYVSQKVIGKRGFPTPAWEEYDESALDEAEEAPAWDLAAEHQALPDAALLPLPQKMGSVDARSEEWAAPVLDEPPLPVNPEAAPMFETPRPVTPEAAPAFETPFPVNPALGAAAEPELAMRKKVAPKQGMLEPWRTPPLGLPWFLR